MVEDKKTRHRNKSNRMSDVESGFRYFKRYYKE